MDSSDHWLHLQGTIHEETGMSSSPSGDMLTCSRPMIERRLRPPHDQALKCPRCDSTHTKFCYYNNYSLSQPRYFCKSCRRYWTKGGTLRNIPVGGGCRKKKKDSSSKKSNDQLANNNRNQLPQPPGPNSYHHNPSYLQLSFPDVQLSHISNLLGTNAAGGLGNPNFMESRYNHIGKHENPIRPIDVMESKLEGIIGSSSSRNFDFYGNSDHMGMAHVGLGDHMINGQNRQPQNFHSLCSHAFGAMSLDDGGGGNNDGGYIMDNSCHRLMLPYDHASNEDHNASIDVKPNPKLLSHERQDQGCSNVGKDSFGYLNGPRSWTGMIDGYGSSATNPLV